MEITLKLLSSKIFRPISPPSRILESHLRHSFKKRLFFLSAFLLSGRTQNATFRLQFHEGNGRNYFRDLFLPGYNSKNHHPRADGREIERNLDSRSRNGPNDDKQTQKVLRSFVFFGDRPSSRSINN